MRTAAAAVAVAVAAPKPPRRTACGMLPASPLMRHSLRGGLQRPPMPAPTAPAGLFDRLMKVATGSTGSGDDEVDAASTPAAAKAAAAAAPAKPAAAAPAPVVAPPRGVDTEAFQAAKAAFLLRAGREYGYGGLIDTLYPQEVRYRAVQASEVCRACMQPGCGLCGLATRWWWWGLVTLARAPVAQRSCCLLVTP